MGSKDTDLNEQKVSAKLVNADEIPTAEASSERASDPSNLDLTGDSGAGQLSSGGSREFNELSVGINIGQYNLLSLLREEADSKLFEVLHQGLNKRFALKAFRAANLSGVYSQKDFADVIAAGRKLEHDSVASIYEVSGAESDFPFVVFDFVDGVKLDKVIAAAGFLAPRRTLQLGMLLCEAAMALENAGLTPTVIHSKNVVVVSPDSDAEHLKVFDPTEGIFSGTAFGEPAGYQRQIGMLLIEMLSGKHPDNLADAGRIANVLSSFSAPSMTLDAAESRVREGLILISAKSLRPPSENFVSIHEILQELQKIEASNPRAKVAKAVKGAPMFVVSAILAIACVACVAYFVFGSAGLEIGREAPKPPPPPLHHSQHIRDKVGRVLFEDDSMSVAGTLVNALHQNANLAGAELHNINLSGITIVTPRLANATFTNCHFTNLQLNDADLSGAKFIGCNLTSIKFKRPTMSNCVFKSDNLNSISFLEAKLKDSKFEDCIAGEYAQPDFNGVHFRKCEMDGVQFIGGRWSYCKLLSSMPNVKASFDLKQSVIMCDNLRGSDFSQATIESCKITVPDASAGHFKNMKNTTIQKKVLE
ncbi:MAG TPA: pentapeptide repeat-containing protein [Drouetiella sp.]